ncbi:MAG TPA: HD domain-containing phosphohydrolase [Noviherbaspirillum sp.]|nr:HD domain-containing phosphohydrolase [Noviherbaspirillum sp.]
MDQKQLTVGDFLIGSPLPWDVYGEGDQLLLKRGQIVQSAHQLEALMARGLYIDAKAAEQVAQARHLERAVVKKPETPSALHFINQANKRLERLLYNLSNEEDAQGKILEVVKVLAHATDINSDVALASVLLNQSAANYAIRHSIDTAIVAMLVARAMQKTPEEVQTIMAAALTMNLGMLRQQDHLEDKQEALTEKENEIIRNHPQESVKILQEAGITQKEWLSYVLLHHENEDGSGYPEGTKVGNIPQNARILAMADRYCAAVSHRKYRKTLMPNTSMRDVLMAGGKASDPMLAAYFIKELGTYPPGTFVRLQNEEIAVVTRRATADSAAVVHAFIGPRNAALSLPLQRNTAQKLFSIRETVSNEQIVLRFSMQQLWGEQASP